MILIDTVHDNSDLSEYESAYNDSQFLASRDYDGQVFDLFDAAQFGRLWDSLDNRHSDCENMYADIADAWFYRYIGEIKNMAKSKFN